MITTMQQQISSLQNTELPHHAAKKDDELKLDDLPFFNVEIVARLILIGNEGWNACLPTKTKMIRSNFRMQLLNSQGMHLFSLNLFNLKENLRVNHNYKPGQNLKQR